MNKVTLLLLGFAVPALTFGCAPEPKTYADCVLQHVKPSMTKEAVELACQACREKFPEPKPVERLLSRAELLQVEMNYDTREAPGDSAKSSAADSETWEYLHNGMKDTLRSVTYYDVVRVKQETGTQYRVRRYRIDLNLPPQSGTSVRVPLMPEDGLGLRLAWGVCSATTYGPMPVDSLPTCDVPDDTLIVRARRNEVLVQNAEALSRVR